MADTENKEIIWLVYQTLMISESHVQKQETMHSNVVIENVIRRVKATNQAEAIGKFLLNTANVKCDKRIEPITAFELDRLLTIK